MQTRALTQCLQQPASVTLCNERPVASDRWQPVRIKLEAAEVAHAHTLLHQLPQSISAVLTGSLYNLVPPCKEHLKLLHALQTSCCNLRSQRAAITHMQTPQRQRLQLRQGTQCATKRCPFWLRAMQKVDYCQADQRRHACNQLCHQLEAKDRPP